LLATVFSHLCHDPTSLSVPDHRTRKCFQISWWSPEPQPANCPTPKCSRTCRFVQVAIIPPPKVAAYKFQLFSPSKISAGCAPGEHHVF